MIVEPPAAPMPLLHLPFDQYGRYQMLAEALDAARPLLGERLRVLDVGGYSPQLRGAAVLPATMFLPGDDVTVIDQVESDLPGYVRGDGRGLAFPDDSFDFVISCDTLEHVPPDDRDGFWRELVRVARYGVLLAAPYSSPETVAAEALLLAFIQRELGVEQLQLKEHASYGLPQRELTAATLDGQGLQYAVFPSGYVHAWLWMMLAKHYLLARTGDYTLHEQVDAYYTRFFGANDRRAPSYRLVWMVEKRGGWLAAAEAAIAPTVREDAVEPPPGWDTMTTWLLHLTQLRTGVNNEHMAFLQSEIARRDACITDLVERSVWLEAQARANARALDAVTNGRAMRLLGWLNKRIKR